MKFYADGAPGTDLWFKTESIDKLSSIADSLERIARCLEEDKNR